MAIEKEGLSGDRIILNGLALSAKIGCTEEERAFPQPLKLDIQVNSCLKAAGETGELSHTVCYDRLRQISAELADSRSWKLVEEIASSICCQIFIEFPTVNFIQITVKKMVFTDCNWAGVSIERIRDQ